ncbi:MAG: hypothetical protein KGM15_09125 [Pseudomonadota bacterium]|nr:hypothetical protein [Pseudomonadota bacterium]
MRLAGFVAAALMTALTAGTAFAQAAPADPLAPGAAAEAAKAQAAPAAAAKTEAAPEKHGHARAKPRHREAGAVAVTVHNDRSVGLVELRLGPTGETDLKKVAGPLAFGRKTVIHVKKTKDCLYDIHAQFADDADTDQTSVDLCKDKAINLTD